MISRRVSYPRKEDEVVDVPAGAEGDGDSTGKELVDQGPFLGDADGIM